MKVVSAAATDEAHGDSDPVTAPRICVYCASSQQADQVYRDAAYRLGGHLASNGYTVVYGGGAVGSMGALADGALAADGHVIGVIPRFMAHLEWAHRGVSKLKYVEDMRTRKHMMLADSAAVVALPGGSGTLEELLETLTLKRLGIYLQPIVLVNTREFFAPLLQLLQQCIDQRFMHARHRGMWSVIDEPEQVQRAIAEAPNWPAEALDFATL